MIRRVGSANFVAPLEYVALNLPADGLEANAFLCDEIILGSIVSQTAGGRAECLRPPILSEEHRGAPCNDDNRPLGVVDGPRDGQQDSALCPRVVVGGEE